MPEQGHAGQGFGRAYEHQLVARSCDCHVDAPPVCQQPSGIGTFIAADKADQYAVFISPLQEQRNISLTDLK